MPLTDIDLFLAKLKLDDFTIEDVEDFVVWANARDPYTPRMQRLNSMRPFDEALAADFIEPAVRELGLRMPSPLEAALTVARHEMRRIVSGAVSPEEGAGNIDLLIDTPGLDFDVASERPELWNFRVYCRYLRGACDVDDSAWYGRVVDDIVAEAEYHLGLRNKPPAS